MNQSAEILCIGTELLIGDIVNTNAAYLARRLAEMGIPVTDGVAFEEVIRELD